jgi:hypothetical protein
MLPSGWHLAVDLYLPSTTQSIWTFNYDVLTYFPSLSYKYRNCNLCFALPLAGSVFHPSFDYALFIAEGQFLPDLWLHFSAFCHNCQPSGRVSRPTGNCIEFCLSSYVCRMLYKLCLRERNCVWVHVFPNISEAYWYSFQDSSWGLWHVYTPFNLNFTIHAFLIFYLPYKKNKIKFFVDSHAGLMRAVIPTVPVGSERFTARSFKHAQIIMLLLLILLLERAKYLNCTNLFSLTVFVHRLTYTIPIVPLFKLLTFNNILYTMFCHACDLPQTVF